MWPDRRYVVQRDEEVKSVRPVALVAGALPTRPTKLPEIEALTLL